MWALFRLWFSKGFWVQLGRKHFWLHTWRSLRRLHKDNRGWEPVTRTAMFLSALAVLFCGGFGVAFILMFPDHVNDDSAALLGGGFCVFFLSFIFIALVRMGAGYARRAAKTPTLEPWSGPSGVMLHLSELALVYAVLADRAASERFLAVKTMPDGLEVTTRRVHLELLRRRALWDRLGTAERDLLMRPDGEWDASAVNSVLLLLEPLRLLRWMLQVDDYLPTIGETLFADYSLAKVLVRDPKPLFDQRQRRERYPLSIARDAANAYYQRCAAEGVKRGYFEPQSAQNALWSLNLANRLEGQQSQDLLLKGVLVSEAEESEIRLAATLSLRRLNFCDRLARWLDGQEAIPNELTAGESYSNL